MTIARVVVPRVVVPRVIFSKVLLGVLGVLAGGAAGATALALDLLLARWTLGYPLAVKVPLVGWYVGPAALLGLAAASLHLHALRSPFRDTMPMWLVRCWAWALCLLYAVPVAERVEIASGLQRPAFEISLVVATLGLYALAAWWLHRAVGLRGMGGLAPLVALAASAAMGLSIHRNVLDSDFSARSLGLDSLTLAGAALLAASLVVRRLRWRWGLVLAGVACWASLAWATRAPDALGGERGSVAERPAIAPSGAPNVIFLVVDTLRWDVFQQVLDETPEGEAFHRAFGPAVRFDRAVAVAPWTAPSVATIFTGEFPNRHRFGQMSGDYGRPLRKLDGSVPTLAQALRNRGYGTYAWVTNPILHSATGISRGFDGYELLQPATTKLPLAQALKRLDLVDSELYQQADALRLRLGHALPRLRTESPFLLWLHVMDPHGPLRVRPSLQPPVGERGLSENQSRYYGEVRFALAELAKMIDMMRVAGIWDDSLVIFVADHGEMFPADGHDSGAVTREGEPKRMGHGHALYESLVHVPLWIHPPAAAGGLEQSRIVTELVSHVDLVHTVSDVLEQRAGLDLPFSRTHSVSLAPWLSAEPAVGVGPPTGRDAVISGFLQHKPPQRALVSRQLKLIDYEGDRVELYDLDADPGELDDLSDERPEAVVEGLKLLEAYWARLGITGSGAAGEQAGEEVELDEETRKRLEALGYL